MKHSQTEKLYNLLVDGKPHRTDEIVREVYGDGLSLSRVGARINDLAAGNWPGRTRCEFLDANGKIIGMKKGELKGWHDAENPKLYWYRMKVIYPIVEMINRIPARREEVIIDQTPKADNQQMLFAILQ